MHPTVTFKLLQADEVDDDTLKACAKLFSSSYAVWGPDVQPPLKPGGNVKMNSTRLRAQSLSAPTPAINMVSICTVNNDPTNVVGHAFATVWDAGGNNTCPMRPA